MKCPICLDPDLVMTHRENIEIDYCPRCRGVWLDRGELDRIIEQSNLRAQPMAVGSPVQARESHSGRAPSRSDRREPDDEWEEDFDTRYKQRAKKKKINPSSFLEDLFDF